MVKAPCYGCNKRAAACHDTCYEYMEWHEKKLLEKRTERMANEVDGYVARAVELNLKRSNASRRIGQR